MTRIDMLRKQLGIPHPAAKGTDMTIDTQVRVPTAHASRYLQQLCKHWSHNLTVDFDETHGTVTFPRDARGSRVQRGARVAEQGTPRHRGPCGDGRRVCSQGVAPPLNNDEQKSRLVLHFVEKRAALSDFSWR